MLQEQPFENNIISVSDLNSLAREVLEQCLPSVTIEGEISNIAKPRSGHIYFSLKDDKSQVRCAMFRNSNIRLRFSPEDGQKVIIKARVTIYEGRGDFQLIVSSMQEAGEGQLQKEFEKLKNKLNQDGLFDRERPLPAFPKRIAVITSPSGAAIQDILSVIKRRYPVVSVLIIPVQVQGEESAPQIVDAFEKVKKLNKKSSEEQIDLVIISRGGGSLEDLWSFNEEQVARAIYDCPVPVITGIGHETDFTIADFVADYRAPTPSVAAEVSTPDIEDLYAFFKMAQSKIHTSALSKIEKLKKDNSLYFRRLEFVSPQASIRNNYQRLDHLEKIISVAISSRIERLNSCVNRLEQAVLYNSPSKKLSKYREKIDALSKSLIFHAKNKRENSIQQLLSLTKSLNALNPLNTLERGYSIITNDSGEVLSSVKKVNKKEKLDLILSDGRIRCKVEETISN